MPEGAFLRDLVVVFGCAAPIVYICNRLKQSPIVGFVVTGALIGPFGLSWIHAVDTVHTLASLGVMILLFSLGLEFSLKKLMETRVAVFLTGPLQVAGTAIPIMLLLSRHGVPLSAGLVYGIIIAVSSTTVLIKVLGERGEIDSIHGRVTLGVAIFQDLCAVPVLVAIPLLAQPKTLLVALALALGKALGVIAAVVLVARYAFPVLLRSILHTRSKELFLITAVFMFLGTAWVTFSAGISLALGSFLAGLILSESEYGHHIFAEVRPFRDSLNSLFFISLGMLVDPRFILSNLPAILGTTAAVVLCKTVLTAGAVRVSKLPVQVAVLSGALLAQIGEFSFVLLQAAAGAKLVSARAYQVILASSLLTMVLAPGVFALARRWTSGRRWREAGAVTARATVSEGEISFRDHVVICGFGVGGRNIASVLKANGTPYVIIDLNGQSVSEARQKGEPILLGDCTSTHILEMAGIHHARVIVFVISDPFAARVAVRSARELNPAIVVLTRTKRVADMDELWDQGSSEVIAEEFEASLELITRILRVYNAPRAMVAGLIKSIRDQRFGLFRERPTTVPRIRLSSDLDVYTETWEVPCECGWNGLTVAESRLRSQTGVLIMGIIRDNRTLNNPGPHERIQGGDRLVLTGTKDQLGKAVQLLAAGPPVDAAAQDR